MEETKGICGIYSKYPLHKAMRELKQKSKGEVIKSEHAISYNFKW